MRITKDSSWFLRFAKATAHATGTPHGFGAALGVVIVWAVTGPLIGLQ